MGARGRGCQMCQLEGLQLEGDLDALTSIIARWCHCWEQSLAEEFKTWPALPYKPFFACLMADRML